MGSQLEPRIIEGSPYIPTSSVSGDAPASVFRMQNLFLRGRESHYWENFTGGLDLSQSLGHTALTGTVALDTTTTVVGTGTAFTTECHLGQFVLAVDTGTHKSYLLAVQSVTSNTVMTIARAPLSTGTVSGLTAYRLPICFAVNDQIGAALRGNVIKLDNGTLFSVGNGVFTLNGSALGGASLTMTAAPQISLLSGTNYTNFPLGMTVPSKPTLASVAGGTVGMQAANYSIVITRAKTATGGYSNPSLRADVTLAATNRIEIDFSASLPSADGSDAFDVWGTLYSDSLGADLNYLNGPWHYVTQIKIADLVANKATVEWLDAQIETDTIITFNNDAPPKAEFIALLNSVPVYVSCEGAGGLNPGPLLVPAKPNNVEAAPLDLSFPTSPPETILGVVSAQGRLYLLTQNHLQVALGTASDLVPIIVQPFWKSGFRNPYQVAFINGTLYGFPTAGPTRSVAEGDEISAEKTWAADVATFTDAWIPCHVLVAHDPKNDAICFFHAADSLNSSGFWTTRILCFGLTAQRWVSDLTLSSTTGDMIVSGVATVGNYLVYIAGGRQSNDSISTLTYQFDTGTSPVSGYLAPQFSDMGDQSRDHVLKAVKVVGELTSGSLTVYGSGASQTIEVTDVENGTNALATQAITTSSTKAAISQRYMLDIPNLELSTVRIAFTWAGGSASLNRLDKIIVEAASQGVRR